MGEKPTKQGKTLSKAAQDALREAQERRVKQAAAFVKQKGSNEVGGRDGLEPTRFGDWEKDGIASDF